MLWLGLLLALVAAEVEAEEAEIVTLQSFMCWDYCREIPGPDLSPPNPADGILYDLPYEGVEEEVDTYGYYPPADPYVGPPPSSWDLDLKGERAFTIVGDESEPLD